jgi:uncharacterized protein (TIGR03000 family)
MKHHWFGCALLIGSVVPFVLPDQSKAGSTHSGGFQRWQSPPNPVSTTSFYAIPALPAQAAPVPTPEEDYAYGALEGVGNDTVLINLRVPANAEVWFDGSKTSQTGRLRSFVSPPLQPGRNYAYEIRARWMQSGRMAEETRRINVRAGDRDNLKFLAP